MTSITQCKTHTSADVRLVL